ncbi:hypothetical protein FB547_112120 [Variovorax beijingensis]|uniref:Uncharacterized protein n=1 Tax=Variovorax beijingensis TaxID=2496117 RepID=A0A561BC58_9BURK|nr:hypothetical protein FB547_112120 [Variovorax beijingensis]
MSTMGDLDPPDTGEWVDALTPNVDANSHRNAA